MCPAVLIRRRSSHRLLRNRWHNTFAEREVPIEIRERLGVAAYITVMELADESSYADARSRLVARAPEHGGTYRVQQAPAEVIEGSLTPQRMAVIEFESIEAARAFLATPEYD